MFHGSRVPEAVRSTGDEFRKQRETSSMNAPQFAVGYQWVSAPVCRAMASASATSLQFNLLNVRFPDRASNNFCAK